MFKSKIYFSTIIAPLLCRLQQLYVREVPAAPHRLHLATAARAGGRVQEEQVSVQTQALRGLHQARPYRNTGKLDLIQPKLLFYHLFTTTKLLLCFHGTMVDLKILSVKKAKLIIRSALGRINKQ